ncbi:isochorismate synthase MenF [Geodermatophilus sp. SYSU D00691]
MTAAAVTSPEAARAFASVRLEGAPALLDALPSEGALSWVRHGEGLVGWGEAARLEVTGPGALAEAARWWAGYTAGAVVDDRLAVPGSGPVLFASVAFDPVAGTSVFVVPEVVVGRRDGVAWVTTAQGADPRRALAAAATRSAADDGDPGRLRYADGALDPVRWSAAVATAVERITAGDLAKVVLARDLLVTSDVPLDPRRLLRRLAARFPGCWTFAVDGLLGATPELLLRRTGRALSARVLAGTAPRGAGAEDERLAAELLASGKDRAEHAFAVDSLVRALQPYCTDLSAPAEPELLTLANVRHLATDVHGVQRRSSRAGLLELIGAVHPTAAVGGAPTAEAVALIGELEGMDRGRYAGPVGWLDARGDGEFGLALRCAEITADEPCSARLFAGCGIVAGSDPAAELAETQAKFAAFRAALEG